MFNIVWRCLYVEINQIECVKLVLNLLRQQITIRYFYWKEKHYKHTNKRVRKWKHTTILKNLIERQQIEHKSIVSKLGLQLMKHVKLDRVQVVDVVLQLPHRLYLVPPKCLGLSLSKFVRICRHYKNSPKIRRLRATDFIRRQNSNESLFMATDSYPSPLLAMDKLSVAFAFE